MTVDVSPRPPTRTEYMGDGVYASFDGYQIWVWTSNGIKDSDKIALEPSVLLNLIDYAKDVGGFR